MKKIFKYLSITCFASLMLYSCRMHTTNDTDFTVTKHSTSFERGKNLVYNICADCHYNRKTEKFTGNQMKDFPPMLGKLYSANLTDSKEYGVIAHYTDAELCYLLKTGIKKDGGYAPYMLRPTLADGDINDIIVYLRSGDDAVSDGDEVAGHTHVNLLGRIGVKAVVKPIKYQGSVPMPEEDNPVAYGEYLVANIGCYHCHSKSATHLNYVHPEDTKGYMAGGSKFKNEHGKHILSPNLTPDMETGIGKYTQEGFRKALQEGISMDDDALQAPMPKFKHLTNKQADAIYAYIMQLPAKHHLIKGQ